MYNLDYKYMYIRDIGNLSERDIRCRLQSHVLQWNASRTQVITNIQFNVLIIVLLFSTKALLPAKVQLCITMKITDFSCSSYSFRPK